MCIYGRICMWIYICTSSHAFLSERPGSRCNLRPGAQRERLVISWTYLSWVLWAQIATTDSVASTRVVLGARGSFFSFFFCFRSFCCCSWFPRWPLEKRHCRVSGVSKLRSDALLRPVCYHINFAQSFWFISIVIWRSSRSWSSRAESLLWINPWKWREWKRTRRKFSRFLFAPDAISLSFCI